MRRYWLIDQHGGDGPTALVETDGRLHIVDVLRFGPSITELDDQQKIWDKVIDRVAPTLTPLVEASSVDEEGVAPHPKLRREGHGEVGGVNRTGRGDRGRGGLAAGRARSGPDRKRARGDR